MIDYIFVMVNCKCMYSSCENITAQLRTGFCVDMLSDILPCCKVVRSNFSQI